MLRRVALLALGLAGLGVLAAGCGGGSHTPGVAQIGTAAATTTSSASAAPTGGSTGPPSGTAFVAFVDCMQKHGVQAQLGPGGQGVSISGGNPASAGFKTAQQDCRKLLPGGGPKALSPAQQALANKALLTLASCMRTHGYPDFPDPDGQGAFDFSSASGFDPNSSQFRAAMNTCQPRNSSVPLRIGIRVGGPGPGQ